VNFEINEKLAPRKVVGLAAVVVFHLLLGYALLSGLARQVVEVVRKPVQATIIEEKKAPPPPKPEVLKATPPPLKARAQPAHLSPPVHSPPPKLAAPEPSAPVAAPVVPAAAVTNPSAPSITATQAAQSSAPSPPAPAVHTSAVADVSACAKPRYPESSLSDEEQGTVTLAFLIGADGTVLDSRVEKSSGSRALDSAARNALSLCKFKPATTDGKPEQSWTRMQYAWKLE
jgi:periplasmic protein TonB